MKKANVESTFVYFPIIHEPVSRWKRQGKGKGSIDRYVFRAKPGAIIEIDCPHENIDLATGVLKQAAYKLPFLADIITKDIEQEQQHEIFKRIESGDIAELSNVADQCRLDLIKIRFDHVGEFKDTSIMSKNKRCIAQCMTLINEKEL